MTPDIAGPAKVPWAESHVHDEPLVSQIPMPSHRRRSYSRDRSGSPADRSRSRSPERRVQLPDGVDEISESDYFLKSDEFRLWLKEEKGKYFDELSSDRARKYFRKLGTEEALQVHIQRGRKSASGEPQTAYKWSFASKTSRADNEALRAAREEIDSTRHHGPDNAQRGGPDVCREEADEMHAVERDFNRKRERKEAKERVEDMVGPKEVGRAGMLEKKKAQRESDKAFREKGDDGLAVDDSTLMGGGDSFQAQIARRDAARKRFEDKREEKMASTRERTDAIRQKDKATMDMFMQMARAKYG
ncbi:uncharacterized protein BXZ73DRAFT_106543 [Epithele typhae]|uniref:uncharacterized protein n=1 Tax=Epithele typhae TaxID=378194 RepID=UPI002007414E|nr:uncharacterized protein BXZ73DRAFT_106543 [Epithele typhae]KAH9914648.1 hypothetical protein BXZ73DRAFT_106543 [Epithele typhae]